MTDVLAFIGIVCLGLSFAGLIVLFIVAAVEDYRAGRIDRDRR